MWEGNRNSRANCKEGTAPSLVITFAWKVPFAALFPTGHIFSRPSSFVWSTFALSYSVLYPSAILLLYPVPHFGLPSSVLYCTVPSYPVTFYPTLPCFSPVLSRSVLYSSSASSHYLLLESSTYSVHFNRKSFGVVCHTLIICYWPHYSAGTERTYAQCNYEPSQSTNYKLL